jgi:NAD(P)-dependent dehydrogenase (short-subunit alcohol dehydrogenase family)
MDLGIKGRRAIVCASSKGLGRACAIALAGEGVMSRSRRVVRQRSPKQRTKSEKPIRASP